MRDRLRTAFCLGLVLVVWLGSAPAVEAQGRGPGARDRAPGLFARAHEPPASLRRWLEGLPPLQRRAVVQRLRKMRPAERRRFFRRWEGMTHAERRHLQHRMEEQVDRAVRAAQERQRRRQLERDQPSLDRDVLRKRVEEMSPPERRAFRRQLNQWRKLGPRGKERMRGRLEVFRSLTPEQQVALIERQFPGKSEDERARILTQLRAAATLVDSPPERDVD